MRAIHRISVTTDPAAWAAARAHLAAASTSIGIVASLDVAMPDQRTRLEQLKGRIRVEMELMAGLETIALNAHVGETVRRADR